MSISQFYTVRQFAEKYPAFSQGSLRHLIFFSQKNGFLPCIRRIGRKILIDEQAFLTWLNQQQTGGAA